MFQVFSSTTRCFAALNQQLLKKRMSVVATIGNCVLTPLSLPENVSGYSKSLVSTSKVSVSIQKKSNDVSKLQQEGIVDRLESTSEVQGPIDKISVQTQATIDAIVKHLKSRNGYSTLGDIGILRPKPPRRQSWKDLICAHPEKFILIKIKTRGSRSNYAVSLIPGSTSKVKGPIDKISVKKQARIDSILNSKVQRPINNVGSQTESNQLESTSEVQGTIDEVSVQTQATIDAIVNHLKSRNGNSTLADIGISQPKPPLDQRWKDLLRAHPERFSLTKVKKNIVVRLLLPGSPSEVQGSVDDVSIPTKSNQVVDKVESTSEVQGIIDNVSARVPTCRQETVSEYNYRSIHHLDDFGMVVSEIQRETRSLEQFGRPLLLCLQWRKIESNVATSIDFSVGNSVFAFDVRLGSDLIYGLLPRCLDRTINYFILVTDLRNVAGLKGDNPDKPLEDALGMHNFLDLQLVGEHLFGEPFLDENTILSKFSTLDENTVLSNQSPIPGERVNTTNLLFSFVSTELQSVCQSELERLAAATRHQMGGLFRRRRRNQVLFDPSKGYRMYSYALLKEIKRGTEDLDTMIPQPGLIIDDKSSNINAMIDILPERMRSRIESHPYISQFKEKITEIVLDVSRRPQFWADEKRMMLIDGGDDEADIVVEQADIDEILVQANLRFGSDNRAGLPGELHRISAMRDNRTGKIYGLTLRIGRHVPGNADLILDHLHGTEKSILILGQPGSGKTTIVREIARLLSEDSKYSLSRNVVIVDTSNEIGGGGDAPHPGIGMARRMMVPCLDQQSAVMLECVQNHTPHVIVVDELGRPKEVAAAGTIKKRGVRMIASAHGDLRGLVDNPELVGLVGGVRVVILGDQLANRRSTSTKMEFNKLCTQRVGAPIFDLIVEVHRGARNEWRVIDDTAKAIDAILDGRPYSYQLRQRNPETGEMFMQRFNDG